MTTCKRYFRNCNEFGICVNIGKKGYVLAEEPTERKTIFQYGIYGIGKFARIFDPNYITFEGGKFYDVREYEKDNVVFEAQEDFFLIGFNKLDDYNWEGRLIDKDESKLDLKTNQFINVEYINKRGNEIARAVRLPIGRSKKLGR